MTTKQPSTVNNNNTSAFWQRLQGTLDLVSLQAESALTSIVQKAQDSQQIAQRVFATVTAPVQIVIEKLGLGDNGNGDDDSDCDDKEEHSPKFSTKSSTLNTLFDVESPHLIRFRIMMNPGQKILENKSPDLLQLMQTNSGSKSPEIYASLRRRESLASLGALELLQYSKRLDPNLHIEYVVEGGAMLNAILRDQQNFVLFARFLGSLTNDKDKRLIKMIQDAQTKYPQEFAKLYGKETYEWLNRTVYVYVDVVPPEESRQMIEPGDHIIMVKIDDCKI